MSSVRIHKICDHGTFVGKGYFSNVDSEPGFWSKREKWKKKSIVRWPVPSRFVLISRCAAGKNVGTIFTRKKLPVLSKSPSTVTYSIAEASMSGVPKVTVVYYNIKGTEANEVCPVPWSDAEGLLDQLPLKVSVGLTLESIGTLYEGPHEVKYWSENRCGLRHPYPVGYQSTKTYKGVQFRQTIEKGPDGPIFVVAEVNKAPCSADSPAKAWSLALAGSQLDSAIRVHGRKHFGFDSPLVLGCLSQLDKEVVKKGLLKHLVLNMQNDEPRIAATGDRKQNLHLDDNGDPEGHDSKGSDIRNKGTQSDVVESTPSAEQLRPLMTRHGDASLGPYERSIRLRSLRVEDSVHQRVEILSCQDPTHPMTRGFFVEAMSSLSTEDSTITETLSKGEFSTGGVRGRKSNTLFPSHTVLKQGVSAMDTSLDSILKRMGEVAGSDGQHGSTSNGNSSWKYEDRETLMTGRTGEHEVPKQSSSMSRIFSGPAHRSRLLSEDTLPKDNGRPAQTRSLANLLEEWNKGGRKQSLLNGKPQLKGELNSQLLRRPTKIERMPLVREEKDDPDSYTSVQTSFLVDKDADLERKLEEWRSGKEGRSSVLQDIQQLLANSPIDQALQLLRSLQFNGANIDDATYSALFPFKFDGWQTQAVKHAQANSVLVSAPGRAGKFVIAARCLYQAFVQGERCLVVTPFEALAKERWQELQILFGSKNVGCVLSKEEDRRSHFPLTVITLETLVKELREGRFSKGSPVRHKFSEGLRLAVMDIFGMLNLGVCGRKL